MAGSRLVNSLEQHLTGYLAVRRVMGYKLARAGKLLPQFTAWMAERDQQIITTELALQWATVPPATGSNWQRQRLSVVRGFAAHAHAIDPAHEIPPADLLPWRPRRAVPYLYTDAEVMALMDSATVIPTAHRAATMRTLIGLLAVTGMRIGEAIRLDRPDIDLANELLVVRDSKFGKSREVALHPSTIVALQRYLARRDRPIPPEPTAAVFTSAAGTRLIYCNVHLAFKRTAEHAGLRARSTSCRPRPHDLRHSFAVNALLDAYRSDENPAARLPLLSTYLGHVHPGSTYWYLQAAPELLALAGERLERHLDRSGR
jgi:integrase